MPNVFHESLKKADLLKRVGDITQIAGALPFTYREGKAGGVDAIEVRTGGGLRFVVLPGRGMDIAFAELQGMPLSYISKTGVVSPAHYDEKDFLRSFTGGLLTTCGLTYMGAPCEDEGVSLGAHGRIANTPAYDVGITQEWQDDDFVITLRGKVREAAVFGESMVLTRTITAKLGENTIAICDKIENTGFEPTPLMVLYHMNFGYPLVSEHTSLTTNCTGLRPRDADAKAGVDQTLSFSVPVHGYREQVFYRDAVENSFAALKNAKNGLSARIAFSGQELPYLVQWKQMGEQEYVVGLEPGTYPPDGRAAARERGELAYLAPQEKRSFHLCLSFEKNG